MPCSWEPPVHISIIHSPELPVSYVTLILFIVCSSPYQYCYSGVTVQQLMARYVAAVL